MEYRASLLDQYYELQMQVPFVHSPDSLEILETLDVTHMVFNNALDLNDLVCEISAGKINESGEIAINTTLFSQQKPLLKRE